jgi:outer membrane protein TolC
MTVPAESAARAMVPTIPPDLEAKAQALQLADVVDLALRNNPETQVAWASARAAAATYGSARGAWFPSLDLDGTGTTLKTIATQGRAAVRQTVYGASVTLSYLLLDFGGRSGSISQAREALISADWTHNAAIQNVVLQAESAFYTYVAARALLGAQQTTVEEARVTLAAAEERHRVGLATIADVLQARTAMSQAELNAQTTGGLLATSRGALAASMGLPANLPYDVDSLRRMPNVALVADSVDSLITRAVVGRPDLAAMRADARAAAARVTQARGARLPALAVNGTGGVTYLAGRSGGGSNYSVTLGLQIPLFNGFSREYDQQAAEAEVDASRARVRSLEQQVIFEVFRSYYALQTATYRARTADDLLASAQQSAEVALGRYREGVGTLIDRLAAEAALADGRAQQIGSRYTWFLALAQLAHDIGSLDATGQGGVRLSDSTMTTPPQ